MSNTKKIRYIICANPRTGSSLLGDILKNTGLISEGEEMLDPGSNIEVRKIDWDKEDLKSFFEGVFESVELHNGVSGFKLMWEQIENLILEINTTKRYRGVVVWDLPSFLPFDVKYIWLKRRDKVRQGVSLLKAGQTGFYSAKAEKQNMPKGNLVFDFWALDFLIDECKRRELMWEEFFRKNKIIPLVLEYEDFVKDFRGTVVKVLDYLGVPVPEDLVIKTSLVKQSDALSEEWVKRYYEELTFKKKICVYTIRFVRNVILHSVYRTSYRLKERFPSYKRFIEKVKNNKFLKKIKKN